MSRAFWFAALSAGGFASLLIHVWADTRTDAGIILAIFVWSVFLLAIIDVFRVKWESK